MIYIKNKHILLLAFLFLFVGFIVNSNITGSSIFDIFSIFKSKTYTCYDSDGGLNYNTYGYVTYKNNQYQDVCLNNNKLKEYYCKSSKWSFSKLGSKIYNCPNGCSNGACVQKQMCIPNWQCGSWSSCVNNQQTRTCTDLNRCNNNLNKPVETQSCTSCIKDNSCIKNTYIGYTCTDSCGNIYKGTKNFCTPKTCSELNKQCGSWDNGCSSNINCGTCQSGYTCSNGQCILKNDQTNDYCKKKNYKMAFILVTDNKNVIPSDLIIFLNKIKSQFSDDFHYATNNLAMMDTSYPLTIIKIDDSSNSDLKEWLKIFYKDNPDIFDFITVYTNFMGNDPRAMHFRTIFTIGGIGDKEFYDDSVTYGSDHVLVGITYGPSPHLTTPLQITDLINLMDQGDLIPSRPLLHETGHQWCCRIGRNLGILEGSENHWNNFFEANIYGEGQGMGNPWKETEPGLFMRKISTGERPRYSELMLYLIGLVEPENAKFNYYLIEPEGEIWIGEDGQYVRGKIKKYITIQDILDSEGRRSCGNKPQEKKEPEPMEKMSCSSRADCKQKCQAIDPKLDGICVENECNCAYP